MIKKKATTYFISAGEFSGDLLAAELVTELQTRIPDLEPWGIVGDAMRRAGVQEITGLENLSVMGIAEVAKKLADIRVLESKTLGMIERLNPAFAILVDFPGFHFRLAEQLRLRGIPTIQYVAPKVWAWGLKRVRQLRENFDMVLGVLPFEVEFFAKHNVPFQFVGCPHKDRTSKIVVQPEELGFDSSSPLIALLPGSRYDEVRRILPSLIGIKNRIAEICPEAKFVMPIARSFGDELFGKLVEELGIGEDFSASSSAQRFGVVAEIEVTRGMSLEVMSIAKAAVVASGTATLECALLGTPMAVVYEMSPFTYEMAKDMVKLPYVSLVNLVAGSMVANEYIQHFSSEEVAKDVWELATDSERRKTMIARFEELRNDLDGHSSSKAAQVIVDYYQAQIMRGASKSV